MNKSIIFLSILFLLLTGKAFCQTVAAANAFVSIEGEVKTSVTLSPAELDSLPKTTIKLKDRNGTEHLFSGASLDTLLKKAGVTMGEQLKGENLAKYLLVEASDGYQVVFSLPEIDPAFTSRKIILANRKDGVLLSPDEGPFRIIIEGEKRLPRNARQITTLKILYAK